VSGGEQSWWFARPHDDAESNGASDIRVKIISKIIFLTVLLAIAPTLFAQNVTVQWGTTYQTIDGFGTACYNIGACNNMTAAQAQLAWDPVNGIGLSLYREFVTDDGSCSGTCSSFYDDAPIKLALGYGVKVWAVSISAPASMKSNGNTICETGGSKSTLNSGSYGAFATYLANYTQQFQSHFGTPLYAMSVQNEPNFCPSGYDGMTWSGSQIQTFVKSDLGPTLAGTGVKIMLPETSDWSTLGAIADPCMKDSGCSQFVGIVASHDYTQQNGQSSSVIQPYGNLGSASLWETETSCLDPTTACSVGVPFTASIQDGLNWAGIIHTYLAVANVSAWHYWRLFNCVTCNDNQALIQADGTIAKRFYVLGNWSKYVRPGWVRIGATAKPTNGVYVTAFKDPSSGDFAIVVANQNSSSVNLTVSLSGFPSVSSVIPTVTSDNDNLADQSSVSVSSGSFSFSLDGTSVTTFHGTPSASSQKTPPPKPPAPTSLEATVN
jgi:glucuronoarabinoxylan endo-1,4-beta-xylanase